MNFQDVQHTLPLPASHTLSHLPTPGVPGVGEYYTAHSHFPFLQNCIPNLSSSLSPGSQDSSCDCHSSTPHGTLATHLWHTYSIISRELIFPYFDHHYNLHDVSNHHIQCVCNCLITNNNYYYYLYNIIQVCVCNNQIYMYRTSYIIAWCILHVFQDTPHFRTPITAIHPHFILWSTPILILSAPVHPHNDIHSKIGHCTMYTLIQDPSSASHENTHMHSATVLLWVWVLCGKAVVVITSVNTEAWPVLTAHLPAYWDIRAQWTLIFLSSKYLGVCTGVCMCVLYVLVYIILVH